MRFSHLVCLSLAIFFCCNLFGKGVDDKSSDRQFQLNYAVSISGVMPGENVRVWLPVPQTTEDQTVEVLPAKFPVKPQTNTETVYGNKITYFELPAPESGTIDSQLSFQIKRREVRGLPGERMRQPMTLS